MIDKDFLLHNDIAKELYHEHAERLPIIDYHCHLDPRLVAEDYRFSGITELWLGGDHYKWRAMRTNGVDERYITGDTSDWEKFQKWAETVPFTMGNPLYHWTHLELQTAFGIEEPLNPETARDIYDRCNDLLQNHPDYTVRGLIRRYGVELVCTTDDPSDSLEWHRKYNEERQEGDCRMLPAWRPDKAMAVENADSFHAYVERLSKVAHTGIADFHDFISALQQRHDYFHEMGCRLSDHGIDAFYATDYTGAEIGKIFHKVYVEKKDISEEEINKFKSCMLYELARMDAKAGWTQQFHYGPIRNNNTRMFRQAGPDTGFDSIGEFSTASEMARFFDRLDTEGQLARSIIYNLNPAANEMVATMIGNYQDGSIPGKMQWGAAWWFMDQKKGIEEHLATLSTLGLLSRFVGMLTDSRSFISYTRHEYFRRILCNYLGNLVVQGEIPYTGYEKKRLQQMVEDVSYNNAKQYFSF